MPICGGRCTVYIGRTSLAAAAPHYSSRSCETGPRWQSVHCDGHSGGNGSAHIGQDRKNRKGYAYISEKQMWIQKRYIATINPITLCNLNTRVYE